ncbi:MerR family transcriptional regulator [Paenibacillus farraposensis]|uniref:MerR family transcriptional regulator n=1 Tax=Paenibacillus farraposensis TaxID=2807095 RepID=A0ABW4DA29_9BACL|nr:MerR family transcriptional regulator [Paenibacillus farraposensis]MCC3378984.1 MerR family transcriptional regulator [Paenibacillus farraposensis]
MEESRSTMEAAKMLGIGASTLRKYAAALEEQGYVFQRSANQSRMFSLEDVECFTIMRRALREEHMTMDQAVQAVLERVTAPCGGEEEICLPPVSDAESLAATWQEILAASGGRDVPVNLAEAAAAAEFAGLQEKQERSEEPVRLQPQGPYQSLASTIEHRLEQAPVSVQTQEPIKPQDLMQMQDMMQSALLEIRSRLDELEAEHSRLVAQNMSLSNQLEDQKRWMKERADEERDRKLITNLRTYQGRQRKSRGSLLSWLGLAPRRRREA